MDKAFPDKSKPESSSSVLPSLESGVLTVSWLSQALSLFAVSPIEVNATECPCLTLPHLLTAATTTADGHGRPQ